ncbi:bifunctional 2-C-methyl-D-erythritol 4-phosphate cytidylyltransferase/2-C-methyl-D-erythritol 2,4-cyclodiphosphate synthase [Octadecabacter sp. CECT 8868]|uniref:bifunctional 2-C-methyl-D-erythritol 4-phosphate cytidylyltransferase/2-C-methyl-D-erythritol 2,4-cyclodiphosphate synthase n=1 Tax=Octadecabacter algicola TaxID=2909342 RepID=UPI001F2296D2|nr:bifunctional 2-C-methyl-D-erythritol 4-phosphate cytidylyltransferase/2-C-methyl-D-erythritol 2,4-cyclodiphosphate synthase [Octadecabacter algicola]MCF2903944.1 bifunctional 2-C-methyl-D-erythritol 4-phosphate cytidylyltransferase/2-C-methyl-D-erythritol 2,4-cyclodiphosphate synthase [Octadecabacter algicola]
MTVDALIVAAGRGARAGGHVPKQWQLIAGKTVVEHTLAVFESHPRVGRIILVVSADDLEHVAALGLENRAQIVIGGAERSLSVLAGLAEAQADIVLVHDAARCCLPAKVIDRVLNALETSPAAAPAVQVSDTLWRGEDGVVTGLQDRNGLYRAQTPQGFHLDAIRTAHVKYGQGATDDVEVARRAGLTVAIVDGDERNLKITTPADFDRAASLLLEPQMIPDIRTGNGFDVHRFGEGDHVVLCGVKVPHERGLQGHSDADVGMHTVTDAIYGALCRGDIGQHFPPSDPQWKGAESHIFLSHACGLARDMGFEITHMDCTLICEFPKIGPVAQPMRARMAEIMQLDIDRVSVKATTSERLGFTGRGEGIAAIATVTLVKT